MQIIHQSLIQHHTLAKRLRHFMASYMEVCWKYIFGGDWHLHRYDSYYGGTQLTQIYYLNKTCYISSSPIMIIVTPQIEKCAMILPSPLPVICKSFKSVHPFSILPPPPDRETFPCITIRSLFPVYPPINIQDPVLELWRTVNFHVLRRRWGFSRIVFKEWRR